MRRLLLRAAAALAAASVATFVASVGATSVARADTGGIPLPDPAASASPVDATAFARTRPSQRGAEPQRPHRRQRGGHGRLDASGDVATVGVDQHLTITGVGDFSLKIPGPATDVSAPPGLPGPAAPDGVLLVEGKGPVRFTATPSFPDPSSVAPAFGRDALRRTAVAIWQTIRLGEVNAYLGNPKPGRSATRSGSSRPPRASAGCRTAPGPTIHYRSPSPSQWRPPPPSWPARPPCGRATD